MNTKALSLALGSIMWSEQQELIVIRGLPGSGKSTLAKRIRERYEPNAHWWEADMFFETESGYVYNANLIQEAHKWCKMRTRWSLRNGFNPVIVSNTFVEMWQMVPYFNLCREFGARLRIIELRTMYGSVHGVPEATMEKMRKKWEPIDTTRLVGIEFYILTVEETKAEDAGSVRMKPEVL